MRLGIIINTNDPETVWNGFRLGLVALGQKHNVNMFLLGKGVEIEEIQHERFDVQNEIRQFNTSGGKILACGTCLKLRNKNGGLCSISSMHELLKLIEESDKLLTLG
ncbi:DsrE family protein [Candidatus Micrarchaeota archaeon]|nr:DsrE family protein [Candidatus Micrarchaeota archaeon]